MMTNVVCILLSLVIGVTVMEGQRAVFPGSPDDPTALLQEDNKNDPAYTLYKEGYSLIMSDRYSDAIKKFDSLVSRYPHSDYRDDAAYWSAYALQRLDKKKGRAAYEKFIATFPKSRYIDDALADMHEQMMVVGPAEGMPKAKRTPRIVGENEVRETARALRNVERTYRLRGLFYGRLAPPTPFDSYEVKRLDSQTRIRLEALRALGEANQDKEAFAALSEVALDQSQPDVLRAAAVETLAKFSRFDVLPIMLEVAKSDTSRDVQLTALYLAADIGTDKNKTADALIALFRAIPADRVQILGATLYAIAEIGNDKAVDFLASVATTHERVELRSDAVYYLGSIGSEKSRSALLRILRGE